MQFVLSMEKKEVEEINAICLVLNKQGKANA